jgi:hypothetical protein
MKDFPNIFRGSLCRSKVPSERLYLPHDDDRPTNARIPDGFPKENGHVRGIRHRPARGVLASLARWLGVDTVSTAAANLA